MGSNCSSNYNYKCYADNNACYSICSIHIAKNYSCKIIIIPAENQYELDHYKIIILL